MFSGHEFAESATVILDELRRHQGKASFFLTGAFLTNAAFGGLIRRMIDEGHYVGPHSDQHLLYCSWEQPKQTLLTRRQFAADLEENRRKLTG
jgi:peptidoglycan/xylan/chitin deacetylase (PgdA/CDA1 family)